MSLLSKGAGDVVDVSEGYVPWIIFSLALQKIDYQMQENNKILNLGLIHTIFLQMFTF